MADRCEERDGSYLQSDLAELCRLVGMPDGAQPRSPHAVFQDCLAMLRHRAGFEYKVENQRKLMLSPTSYTEEDMVADLNKHGAEGWELVKTEGAMLGNTLNIQSIWKRRIVETRQ